VRSADDNTTAGAGAAGQVGNGGGGHWAQQTYIHSGSGESGFQRRFEHVTGDARVLADEYGTFALAGQYPSGRPAQFHDELRRNGAFAHAAPDTIGTEIFPLRRNYRSPYYQYFPVESGFIISNRKEISFSSRNKDFSLRSK
jgi:hypothetical protein